MKINGDLIVDGTNHSLGEIPFGVIPDVASNLNYFKIGNIMVVWGNRFVTLNWNGNSGEATFDLTNDGTPFLDTNYRLLVLHKVLHIMQVVIIDIRLKQLQKGKCLVGVKRLVNQLTL